jgi:hypothetical protein
VGVASVTSPSVGALLNCRRNQLKTMIKSNF